MFNFKLNPLAAGSCLYQAKVRKEIFYAVLLRKDGYVAGEHGYWV